MTATTTATQAAPGTSMHCNNGNVNPSHLLMLLLAKNKGQGLLQTLKTQK